MRKVWTCCLALQVSKTSLLKTRRKTQPEVVMKSD
jgi:hypothetical protein